MRSRVIGIVLILLLILPSGVSFGAVNLSKSYTIDDGVTLYLPDDWTEISRDDMNEMTELLTQGLGVAAPAFDFGFQLKGAELFDYPYMVVIKNNTGRIRESELRNIAKVDKEMGDALDSAAEELGSFVDNISLGEQVYDEEGKRLISKVKTDVALVGSVYMVMGMQLTSRGYIQFMLYCTESQYEQYGEVFSQIINSIEVTGDALYSSATLKSLPGPLSTGPVSADGKASAGMSPVLIAVIILVIGIIIFAVIRSRSKSKTSPYGYDTPKTGDTDWFCPKCRHGNSFSSSVCKNCSHSIV